MTRGFGEVAAIQTLLPDWMALALGVLTQLGDVWFLLLLLGGLYWSRKALRREVLLVLGTYVAGLGLYQTLKYVFELPRPNDPLLDPAHVPALVRPLYEATAFASGYGFPSGHATSVTIVAFGLATVLPTGNRRSRYGVAVAAVAVVSFTRVALGLHFLVDVLAGAAVGGLLVGTALRARNAFRDGLTVVLAGSVLTSGLFLVASGAVADSLLTAGLALGLFGGWQLLETVDGTPGQSRLSPAVRGGLAAVSLGLLVTAVGFVPMFGRVAAGGFVGIAAAIAVVAPELVAVRTQ